MHFLLLAQAPTVFSSESQFTWPILLVLVALAGAAAQSQWRIGQAEKEIDGLKKEQTSLRAEHSALTLQVNSQQVILGEIRTMVAEIRADLRRKEAS